MEGAPALFDSVPHRHQWKAEWQMHSFKVISNNGHCIFRRMPSRARVVSHGTVATHGEEPQHENSTARQVEISGRRRFFSLRTHALTLLLIRFVISLRRARRADKSVEGRKLTMSGVAAWWCERAIGEDQEGNRWHPWDPWVRNCWQINMVFCLGRKRTFYFGMGFFERCHYNFKVFEICHYNSGILKRTITILAKFEICHWIR